jgi:hypothetical protein
MIKARMKRWASHIVRMGEMRNVYTILFGKSDGKRSLGRCTRRWEEKRISGGKYGVEVRIGFMWLRTGTRGGLL